MDLGLSGARVLVTAGASGIGLVIAEAFAAAGARVAICDRAGEHISGLQRRSPEIVAYMGDIGEAETMKGVVAKVADDLGGLDVLVNNAGVTGPFGAIDDIDIGEWERTVAVNVNGTFYVTRCAVPLLRRAGGGSIINISSIAGRLGYAFRTPYCATKWAIIGMTQSLAKELGPDKVRVNAILPGFVAGPRHERNAAARANILGISLEDHKKSILSKISKRELTQPSDIANSALFLASRLGAHISGQSLSVCGNVETM
ncbi:SDR family oxidoreductase [Xanthobacter flavus]|uniref:SDR family oxidoreductase n=1 Tax=Xanthobacter flavus TaxID=281 RepID=UPI00372C9B58